MSMKNNLFAYLQKHHIHIDRHILSYMMCVVIAAILWFLNALNKEYTSEITYPVKYTDFPKGKYLVSTLPKSISLEIKATGFSLLRYRISTSFLPITLDVNGYSNHLLEKNNILEYTLQLKNIKDKITNQLNSDIKLLDIKPQEIDFKFSYAVSRKVPVHPIVDYKLKKQYILKNKINVTPDSILITGPAIIVDTLKYIPTEHWNIGEIKKDISKDIQLAQIPGITNSIQDVRVTLQLERFTEAQKSVPIKVIGLPDSLTIRLFPASVDVTYDVGLSMYDRVSDKDFNFIINYKDVGKSNFLPIQVTQSPSFIKNLAFSPQKVEYILEQK